MLRAVLLTSLTALTLGLALNGLRSQTPSDPAPISIRNATPSFADEMDGFRLIQEQRSVTSEEVEGNR